MFFLGGWLLLNQIYKVVLNREEKEWHISIISYSNYHQHNSIEYNIIVTPLLIIGIIRIYRDKISIFFLIKGSQIK